MNSSEIRDRFLRFFEERGHTVVPSDLLVPQNDPTLLFTGAGMNQFKEQFMGKNITYKRAVSSQKCMRTGDVENVGKTPRHHTFFEMLGNFSFGDYFKKEAIFWGWEFMTREMGIPEERLWISVYEKDEESYHIWRNDIKVPAKRIVKMGPEDNFWPANAPLKGPNGPCGPCSEIFYDWGETRGCGAPACGPACDCGRFVEVWNLVFTELERKSDGSLIPLPSKNIDTGMGLERITAVKQDVYTNFGTDLFTGIIERIKDELGKVSEKIKKEDIFLIADHLRAAVLAIGDGVSPSNEKQGYVIRKLIRRAYMKGREKGGPFLFNAVPAVTDVFRDIYPDLNEKREHLASIVKEEERRFDETLRSGMPIMEDMFEADGKILKGGNIFKLVDTYGMPFEIIDGVCSERGIGMDEEGFKALMEMRKEESRKGSDISCDFIFKPDDFNAASRPEYSDNMPLKAEVSFIVKDGKETDGITEGDCAEIVTSPQSSQFYAESGGQVGDKGSVTKPGARMDIVNTVASDGRKILQVVVKKGSFRRGDEVEMETDKDKKDRTAKNHTATHLLQAALRRVLGEEVKQSGSFVNDKRLRFDFTYMKKLSHKDLIKIEDTVNGWISSGKTVKKETKSIKEAKEEGALSFFGEKYGDTVRVITVGEYSKELCGGTHVDDIAEIGAVKIINESSVASGIRRIEALTSDEASEWIRTVLGKLTDECGGEASLSEEVSGGEIMSIIKGDKKVGVKVIHDFEEKFKPVLAAKSEETIKRKKQQQKKSEANSMNAAQLKADVFIENSATLGGVKFISGILENGDANILRGLTGYIGKKAPASVVLLGAGNEGKASLVCAVGKDLVDSGISAKDIIDSVAEEISGGGGGNPSFAQAGGKKQSGLKSAIEKAGDILSKRQ
ncbi:MAG: alanine--tRNA ligase [Candidatus Omnitrophota bacterium]